MVILNKIYNSPITGHPGKENTFALLAIYLQDYPRFLRNYEIYTHSQVWQE